MPVRAGNGIHHDHRLTRALVLSAVARDHRARGYRTSNARASFGYGKSIALHIVSIDIGQIGASSHAFTHWFVSVVFMVKP